MLDQDQISCQFSYQLVFELVLLHSLQLASLVNDQLYETAQWKRHGCSERDCLYSEQTTIKNLQASFYAKD